MEDNALNSALDCANNGSKRNKRVMQAAVSAATEKEAAAAILAAVPDASEGEIATAVRVRKIVFHDLIWPRWFYADVDPRRII